MLHHSNGRFVGKAGRMLENGIVLKHPEPTVTDNYNDFLNNFISINCMVIAISCIFKTVSVT